MTYLGLPISTRRICIVHLQFPLDRIRARLAGWKGRLMNMVERRVLVRSMLSAMPTFVLTVLRPPKKLLKDIDKTRRRFLWAQEEEVMGGKCKVSWQTVCSPIAKGGLGIQDLQLFGRALRLRWLWLAWTQPAQPWKAFQIPCDNNDRALFARATKITIGNGKTAKFWTSC